jgi:hypothetical protein
MEEQQLRQRADSLFALTDLKEWLFATALFAEGPVDVDRSLLIYADSAYDELTNHEESVRPGALGLILIPNEAEHLDCYLTAHGFER